MPDKNGNHPDYYTVEVPKKKPPEEYTYVERRAEILDLILERGSPHGIKQYQLANRYDVSEGQISHDMKRLRKHVSNHLGREAKMTTRAAYQKVITELKNEEEWKTMWDVIMEWNEWLQDIGMQEREPDKHEISAELNTEHTEKKMLVGVDIDSFPEVDPQDMVGVDMREDVKELEEGAAEIEVDDAQGE